MELDEFKCEVCPRKIKDTEKLETLKEDLLNELYGSKSGFTKEDDFDLACTVVEKVLAEHSKGDADFDKP